MCSNISAHIDGGPSEGSLWADPGVRTPIGVSKNFQYISLICWLPTNSLQFDYHRIVFEGCRAIRTTRTLILPKRMCKLFTCGSQGNLPSLCLHEPHFVSILVQEDGLLGCSPYLTLVSGYLTCSKNGKKHLALISWKIWLARWLLIIWIWGDSRLTWLT